MTVRDLLGRRRLIGRVDGRGFRSRGAGGISRARRLRRGCGCSRAIRRRGAVLPSVGPEGGRRVGRGGKGEQLGWWRGLWRSCRL